MTPDDSTEPDEQPTPEDDAEPDDAPAEPWSIYHRAIGLVAR